MLKKLEDTTMKNYISINIDETKYIIDIQDFSDDEIFNISLHLINSIKNANRNDIPKILEECIYKDYNIHVKTGIIISEINF